VLIQTNKPEGVKMKLLATKESAAIIAIKGKKAVLSKLNFAQLSQVLNMQSLSTQAIVPSEVYLIADQCHRHGVNYMAEKEIKTLKSKYKKHQLIQMVLRNVFAINGDTGIFKRAGYYFDFMYQSAA
jgi:hypothetical protein